MVRMLTIKQCAEHLQVSDRTIRDMISKKKFCPPSARISSLTIRKSILRRLLKSFLPLWSPIGAEMIPTLNFIRALQRRTASDQKRIPRKQNKRRATMSQHVLYNTRIVTETKKRFRMVFLSFPAIKSLMSRRVESPSPISPAKKQIAMV